MLNADPAIAVVAEAGDGKEAVHLVREILPDVILMDINMPKMNGIKATRIIHSEFPDIRIIGLSMYDESGLSAAIMDAGACGYCSKSDSTAILVAAIKAEGPVHRHP